MYSLCSPWWSPWSCSLDKTKHMQNTQTILVCLVFPAPISPDSVICNKMESYRQCIHLTWTCYQFPSRNAIYQLFLSVFVFLFSFVFFCFQTSQGMILLSKLWSKQLHYETQYSVYIKDYFQKLKPSSFFLNKFNISTYTLIVQQCSSARTTENNQPHQPLKQSHAEDHAEQIEATNREDYCWRTGRLQSRKEHHKADLQTMNPLW